METTLFYLLRVTITATILYLFFKFILSKRTFHAINRIVVLCMVVMTLVLPLFTIKLPEITFSQPKVETATTQLTIEEALAYLNATNYSNTTVVTPTPAAEIPWIKILSVIYLIGLTIALLRFVISFIRMSRIIRQTQKVRLDDKSLLCISDKKVSPFSWMKYIVLSKDDFADESKDIIRHEQAHVAFGHSYDLLFLDLYSLVFWFNPFAWLLRLELQTIHEYQADEKVLAEGANAKNYHLSLIRQCVGEYKFALANNFEYNNLHKRIKMTMKTKSSSHQKWLYGTIGLSVMLCIVVLSFSGLKAKAADLKEMIQSELLPTDSIKKSTPAVIRIRKVAVKNNETVTPQIIVRDTVARDTKIKIRTSQNEDIRVVGYGTLNGAKPLIIVDGKESFNGMSSIDENNISGIQVLKDASATKLYGEKGKDGVILITTKKNSNQSNKNGEITIVGKEEMRKLAEQQSKLVLSQLNGQVSGSKPLIIIDGEESTKPIDQNKIENIEVLKGKFAVDKYGDKGKDGVVVVTTKKNLTTSKKTEEIKVIGYRSLTGAQPLILVDGKEAPDNYMQNVVPETIGSMTVLKDASSTAVYGSKGKNGVILITTKKNAVDPQSKLNYNRIFHNNLSVPGKNKLVSDLPRLELVDGKEVPTNFMQTVSEDDIESITVLKDTAATRLYGEKGKNGAILIKMKKK